MQIKDLKVGDCFEKGDGQLCRLELLNDCRAYVYVTGLTRKVEVDIWGTTKKRVYSEYRSISPGTEVLRVLDKQITSDRADIKQEGIIVKTKTKKANSEPQLPDQFTRYYHGVAHMMQRKGDGWSLDGGESISLHEAMTQLLKLANAKGHACVSYFFHPSKCKSQQDLEKASVPVEPVKEKLKTKKATEKAKGKKVKKAKKKPATSGLPFSKEKQLGKSKSTTTEAA